MMLRTCIYLWIFMNLFLFHCDEAPEPKVFDQISDVERLQLFNADWNEFYKINRRILEVSISFDVNSQLTQFLIDPAGNSKLKKASRKYIGLIHYAFEQYLNKELKLGLDDVFGQTHNIDELKLNDLIPTYGRANGPCNDGEEIRYQLDLTEELTKALLFGGKAKGNKESTLMMGATAAKPLSTQESSRTKEIKYVRVFRHDNEDKYSYQFYGGRADFSFLVSELSNGGQIQRNLVKDVDQLFHLFDPLSATISYGKEESSIVMQLAETTIINNQQFKIIPPQAYATDTLLTKIEQLLNNKKINSYKPIATTDLPKILIALELKGDVAPIKPDKETIQKLDMSAPFRLERPLEKK